MTSPSLSAPPFKILCVAGARPNFMKVAPILRALRSRMTRNSPSTPVFDVKLVHTGQHYDEAMSKVFFEELAIPRPDIELEVGSGSHAQQTAEILKRFEPVLIEHEPHAVLVVGDVNSTIGCAMVAAKMPRKTPYSTKFGPRIRPLVIHVEAGLRSGDDDMPEEINRKLTDAISDLLYVSDPSGMDHLAREGVAAERIEFVGNVMIDTLLAAKDRAMQTPVLEQLGIDKAPYALLTLHRPSNVDDPVALRDLIETVDLLAREIRVVFPVHPRTRQRIEAAGIVLDTARWTMSAPLGYLEFLKLTAKADVVLTDSGGIQEETTVLGVPCLTLRENTERPVTLSEGTNVLVGTKREAILQAFATIRAQKTAGAAPKIPRFWDGKSAERIAESLENVFLVGGTT